MKMGDMRKVSLFACSEGRPLGVLVFDNEVGKTAVVYGGANGIAAASFTSNIASVLVEGW